jgi:hypothetical protein
MGENSVSQLKQAAGPNSLTPRLTNIVKVAVRVIAGSDKRQVSGRRRSSASANRRFIAGCVPAICVKRAAPKCCECTS